MELINRSLIGDQQAFGALFDQYKNLVFKTAYLMLGNAEDAEDALQEVFLQVYRSLCTFDRSKGAFTTWLHRITVNHCLNRRRIHSLAALTIDDASTVQFPDRTVSQMDRLGEEEAMQLALDTLSQKLRAVIVLRYYWDLSHAEIAEVLEIPVGTVKSRLNLGLNTLRKVLEAGSGNSQVQYVYEQRELPR